MSTLWQPWLEQYRHGGRTLSGLRWAQAASQPEGTRAFLMPMRITEAILFALACACPFCTCGLPGGEPRTGSSIQIWGAFPLDSGLLLVDDWLEGLIELSVDKSLPILFTLNGGVWGDANGGFARLRSDRLSRSRDPRNCQWDQHDKVYPDDLVSGLPGSLKSPELIACAHFERLQRHRPAV